MTDSTNDDLDDLFCESPVPADLQDAAGINLRACQLYFLLTTEEEGALLKHMGYTDELIQSFLGNATHPISPEKKLASDSIFAACVQVVKGEIFTQQPTSRDALYNTLKTAMDRLNEKTSERSGPTN